MFLKERAVVTGVATVSDEDHGCISTSNNMIIYIQYTQNCIYRVDQLDK